MAQPASKRLVTEATAPTAVARALGWKIITDATYGSTASPAATRAAVVAALADVAEGGTVYIPEGNYSWAGQPDIVVTKPRITITGPGIVNGRFKIGDGASRSELGTRIRDLRFVRALDKSTYPTKGYADGSYFIALDRVRDVVVEGCEFYGAAWPIYAMPNASAVSHDLSMIRVQGNRFGECDWAFYSTFDPGSEWQALADSYFTSNVVNRSYVGMFYAQGIDGVHISSNVHFMINYGSTGNPRFSEKMQNIRIDYSDWAHITDNNLFEAGTEAILMTNARTYSIVGNLLAWSGQRVFSHAIDVTAGTGEYAQGTVSANGVMYYTRSAVRLAGNHGEVQVGPNPVRYSASSVYYVGSGALTDVAHFRYDLSGITGLAAAQIGIADGVIAKTGHYDSLPGHSYIQSLRLLNPWSVQGGLFRSITFTASTAAQILALKDVAEATTTYQGELTIVAKFGSSSTAKTSIYKLLVSKTPAGTNVTDLGKLGYTSGTAADEPAFTWAINSAANTLQATPVGSTAGTFTFSVVFVGNILVG